MAPYASGSVSRVIFSQKLRSKISNDPLQTTCAKTNARTNVNKRNVAEHRDYSTINQKGKHWRLVEQHDRLKSVVNQVDKVVTNEEIQFWVQLRYSYRC